MDIMKTQENPSVQVLSYFKQKNVRVNAWNVAQVRNAVNVNTVMSFSNRVAWKNVNRTIFKLEIIVSNVTRPAHRAIQVYLIVQAALIRNTL